MIKILLAPSLALTQTVRPEISIEAEYGGEVVLGTVFTAAHHQSSGPYSPDNSPAPCNNEEIPRLADGTILVSHLDLDTIAGCLRTQDTALFQGEQQGFWNLAEFVDLRGMHRIGQSGASEEDIASLHAYWAAAKSFPRFPIDLVSDVTEAVNAAREVLTAILIQRDKGLLDRGAAFVAGEQALNMRTFESFDAFSGVIGRIARSREDFCNHLYTTPTGVIARAVVAWNEAGGGITVSLADPIPRVSCRSLVQELWGMAAGGRDGISGSPRGQMMTREDFERAKLRIIREISPKRYVPVGS